MYRHMVGQLTNATPPNDATRQILLSAEALPVASPHCQELIHGMYPLLFTFTGRIEEILGPLTLSSKAP